MENVQTAAPSARPGDRFLTIQDKVRGTNISETTLLATDYLNHFNEVVMMLDMVPAMPVFLEDLREWKPRTYQQHFREASFSDAELAVEAYDHVPLKYREPFEEIIALLNRFVSAALRRLEETVAADDHTMTATIAKDHSERLTKLINLASAIIHGEEGVWDQAQIDTQFPDPA